MSIIQYKKNSGQLKLTANVVDSDYVFAGFYKRTDSDRILLSNSNTYTFTPTEEINIDCDVRLSPCGEKKHNLINAVNSVSDEFKRQNKIPYQLFYRNFNDKGFFIGINPEYYNKLVEACNGLYGDIVGYRETPLDNNIQPREITTYFNGEKYGWVIYYANNDSVGIDSLNLVPSIPQDSVYDCFRTHNTRVNLPSWKVDTSEQNTALKFYYNEHKELIAQIPILSDVKEYNTHWNNLLKNGLPLFKRSQTHGNSSYFETDRENTFDALAPFKTPDYGFYIIPNDSSNAQTTMMSKKNTSEVDGPIISPKLTTYIRLIIEHEYFKLLNKGLNFDIPFVYSKTITLENGIQPKFGHLYKDTSTNKYTVYIG